MPGAWKGSDRKSRLPRDWHSLRRRVLNRDKRLCQLKLHGCTTTATEVDHIVRGDDHSIGNLQAVCSACHAKKSSREGNHAQNLRRVRGRRPPENHPGLRKTGS